MPSNFFWFSEDRIAGMERPGTYHPIEEDLSFLKKRGIEVVISLTLESLQRIAADRYSFELFHIPIVDGSAPTIPQIEQFINYINYALNNGKKILAHCGAGYGRTGTMLACYLVSLGYTAQNAISHVREKAPQAIENRIQELRIAEYEQYLKERKNSSSQ
ncbi:MAG: dual specificity protein phosphatase family protein [Candidatus Aureabacteria bacterium]|nr:dual specificity protein phosphatase family protein [Candidatus Auribacterota bacterium]